MEVRLGTRVGGYIRVSGETQLLNEPVMDVQKERIEKYCSFMNLDLVEVYSDPATNISYYPFRDRPSGSKLIGSCS